MQNVKNSYPYRLILIGFSVFGIVVGCVLGYMFVALDEAGAFSKASWKLLDSPLKFQHIVDATTRKVWAKTEENKFYCLGFPGCDQWTETGEVSLNSHEEYDHTTISKKTCKPDGIIKYPGDPRGNVVECALSIVYFGVETRSIVYYALLDDGTIWVWKSSGPWYVGLGMLVEVIFPFIGLVFGLLAYKSFQKNQKNRSGTEKINDIKQ